MDPLVTCPECRSTELHHTKRILDSYTEIDVVICGVCHWASDPRVGRPPADRGKNMTLRRLISDVKAPKDETEPSEDDSES